MEDVSVWEQIAGGLGFLLFIYILYRHKTRAIRTQKLWTTVGHVFRDAYNGVKNSF